MGGDVSRKRCGASGEGTKVKERRHARAIVHRVIIPQERLAAQLLADALDMGGADLVRANLLTSPEDIDRRIEGGPEVFEVVLRPPAEEPIEDRVVGVIAGTDDQLPRSGALFDPMKDARLRCRKLRQIATHVVEQDRQNLHPDPIEPGELSLQVALRGIIEVAVYLKRAEANAKTHVERTALGGKR